MMMLHQSDCRLDRLTYCSEAASGEECPARFFGALTLLVSFRVVLLVTGSAPACSANMPADVTFCASAFIEIVAN
jgi:hypothetical protein